MFRRYTRLALIFSFAFAAVNAAAQERDYPNRPIRLVVGFSTGGTTDFMARLLADRLRGPLGQTVIVENRTGANGAIGAEYVARSEPDGYTLYFTTAGVAAVYPHLRPAPYDSLRDFAPVSLVAFNSTMLVVNAGLPVKSAVDLAALARERPGEITLAITALGSVSHLGLVLFQSAAGVQFQQVPYRGAAPAMTDLLGGTLTGCSAMVPPSSSMCARAASSRWPPHRSNVRTSSRTCRPSSSRASPTRSPTNGPVCSHLRARPRRSSTSSMPRSQWC
jgi:tripartite-type tricarboxylate transporter receptor subunit TctC